MRRRNLPLLSLIALICIAISGCMQSPTQEMPQALIDRLNGTWNHSASHSSIHFFKDATVKLTLHLPGDHAPIQLLSTYELMKDGAIAISLGNAWRGPARVTLPANLPDNTLLLHIPGKNKDPETLFKLIKFQTK